MLGKELKFQGQGHDSTGEVLALQRGGPTEDNPGNPRQLTHEIPALGRQRHEDPWGSLANQSDLLGELQANKRPCLNGGQHT